MPSVIFRISVISLIVYEGILLYILFNLAKNYRNARFPRGSEWEREVSEAPSPLPAPYTETDNALRGMGFSLLAIQQVKLYEMPTPVYTWVYRSEDAKIWVEVAFNSGIPVILGFFSAFADSAMIMTRYPIGEAIVTPTYISTFARHSIANAHTHHLQRIAQWREAHGDPLTVQSLSDITWHESIYRRKYQRKDYARVSRRTLVMIGFTLLIILCNGFGLAALDSENIYTSALAMLVIFLLSFRLFLIPMTPAHPVQAVDDPTKAEI